MSVQLRYEKCLTQRNLEYLCANRLVILRWIIRAENCLRDKHHADHLYEKSMPKFLYSVFSWKCFSAIISTSIAAKQNMVLFHFIKSWQTGGGDFNSVFSETCLYWFWLVDMIGLKAILFELW